MSVLGQIHFIARYVHWGKGSFGMPAVQGAAGQLPKVCF
jgi:hypothetical protein